MKKHLSLIITLGFLFALLAGPATAEDKAKDELQIKAQAIAGAEFVGAVDKSSKFYEYRDVPQGFVFDVFNLNLTKGSRYLTLSAEKIRQRDGRYTLALGDEGLFKADFTWDKIPHRYSFFAQTLYVPMAAPAAGPGVFNGPGIYYYGLSDQLQSVIEGAPDYAAARALLSGFLTGVHGIDLGLQRNKGTMNLEYTPSVPLTLSLNASRETRKGNRAIGASFGLNNAVEMPEPIDFVTTDLNAKIELVKSWGLFRVGYDVSIFDNENQAMIWDNPYRLTDRTYAGAYSNGDATSRGQMALWPSNNAQKVFLNGLVKVFKHTRITGSFSYGTFSQNERLLPFTINSTLAVPNVADPTLPFYSGALQAPRETSEAKANILTFDLTLHSRIFQKDEFSSYLNAGFRTYGFSNKTAALDLPGFAVADQVWTAEDNPIEPYSFWRSKAFADLSMNLIKNTSLKFGYSRSWMERRLGGEIEGQPEDKSHEDAFKVSADTNPIDWFLVRFSYSYSVRRRALDSIEQIYPTFNFKRYYDANKNRSAINVLIGLTPIKNLDLELSYMLGDDTYPTADYGLKDDRFHSYSADLSYALGKRASIYGFYSYELYKADQASRQSGASFSTNPADDWSALLKDKVDTIGGGYNMVLVKNKLNFDISYSYSKVKGTSKFLSPPGGSPDLAVNFTNNNLDTTMLQTIKTELLWKLASRLSVAFGYWYEHYDLADIVRNNAGVDFVVTGFGMYLGALEPSYKYHVGSVKFIYSW
ncbi:MAG: MtrB/PioB family decaheme-associated outer membrane protein [Candidatus Aminicenantales bacterium]